MRMYYTAGDVWVSWEKGSDKKRLELHGPLGSDSKTNYFSVEDVGEEDARVKWNAGGKAVAVGMDATSLRDLANELNAMANCMDKRDGRPVTGAVDTVSDDPLLREFFDVFDPKQEQR